MYIVGLRFVLKHIHFKTFVIVPTLLYNKCVLQVLIEKFVISPVYILSVLRRGWLVCCIKYYEINTDWISGEARNYRWEKKFLKLLFYVY